jgi:ketosteroid isomerase-like protein
MSPINPDSTPGRSPAATANVQTVQRFYQYFIRDKPRFMALWAANPVVEIPFAPPGIPESYATRELFAAFWDPIFQYTGKFEWQIVELIVGENPDEIVAVTQSDVDAQTPLGPRRYQAKYLQIFRFEQGRIRLFREYVDTARMIEIYGDFGAS